MESKMAYKDIDGYIKMFPSGVKKILQELRAVIRQSAPDAEEKISYQIPTFALKGNLVHFAAYKTHIGFYPTPGGIEAFKEELARYKSAKGSVQFPINEPLPMELIRRIVEFRVNQNLSKYLEKKKKNK